MVARLCFLLKKIFSFPTATQENIEKSFVFPDPLILALLFSHTCPRACISGLENTCEIQKIFRFSPVLLWEIELFFFKRKHKRATISFHPQII